MKTEILKRFAVIATVTLPLALAQPDCAIATAVPAGTLEPASVLAERAVSAAEPSSVALHLQSSPPAEEAGRWRTEFTSRPHESSRDGLFLLQRGEYKGEGLSLLAEMGDLKISGTPNTVDGFSRRGGRLELSAGTSAHALRLQTFASSGGNGAGPGGTYLGATGELSLLADTARFKTIYLSGRESLNHGLKPTRLGERRGDVLGLVAVLEPFKGRLAAEAELDFASYDRDTADDVDAVKDTALKLQLGGELGKSRYKALYEKIGPDYRVLGAKGPKRDSEGVSLGVETSVGVHGFDVKLSKYHNNTENKSNQPRLYRYEGLLDYTFKAIEVLPLGLRYKKTFIDSDREPVGYVPKRSEEDAVAGKLNYLAGKWDLGVLASYSLRTDRIRDEREAKATAVSFLPKFAAGGLTVAPDLSLQRTMDYAASQRTDRYAVSLGVNGSALDKKLDYQLKGGFKREWAGSSYRKETVGANLKAAYPFAGVFKRLWHPSFGITGEYNGIMDRLSPKKENAFTLLFSMEGRSFL